MALCLPYFGELGATPLTPSPLTIALSLGQWLIKEKRNVYYVQVEATAENKEQARQESFRLAVEMAVGSLVVSELEVKNNELIRNDVFKYSAGFVDDFSIKSESLVGNKTRLVVDVWVSESKIADRLLNVSKADGTIDGSRSAAQINSLLIEKKAGDQLLDLVTRDFPKRAFDVKTNKAEIRIKERNAIVKIRTQISWNKQYFESLAEAFERTRDGEMWIDDNRSSNFQFVVTYLRKQDWLPSYASYTDTKKQDILLRNIIASRPNIKLTIKDSAGANLVTACFEDVHFSGTYFGPSFSRLHHGNDQYGQPLGQLFASSDPKAHFGFYGTYIATIDLALELKNLEPLSEMSVTEAQIVRSTECK